MPTGTEDLCLTIRVHAASPLPEAGRIRPDRVLLDLHHCRRPDSRVVSRLITLYRAYHALGVTDIRVVNPSPTMRELLRVLEADKVLPIAA